MASSIITLAVLKHYDELIKNYIDIACDLKLNHKSRCPNCGAPIVNMKCDYCDTNFRSMLEYGTKT